MLNDIKIIKNVIKHKCLLGIVNPPNDDRMLEFKDILDFCILGSVEERDSLLKYVNFCIYYPLIEIWFSKIKKHTEKDQLVIGYHGNREHLKSFVGFQAFGLVEQDCERLGEHKMRSFKSSSF